MKRLLFIQLFLLWSVVHAYAVPVNVISSNFQVYGEVEGEHYIGGNPMFETLSDAYSSSGSSSQMGSAHIEMPASFFYLDAHSTADFFAVNTSTEAYDDAISGFGEAFAQSNILFQPLNDFGGLSIDYVNDIWGRVEVMIYDVTTDTVILDSKYCGGGLGMGYTVALGQFSESVADTFLADHTYQLALTAYKNSNEDCTFNSSITVNGLEMYIVPESSTLFLLGTTLLVLLIGNMMTSNSGYHTRQVNDNNITVQQA